MTQVGLTPNEGSAISIKANRSASDADQRCRQLIEVPTRASELRHKEGVSRGGGSKPILGVGSTDYCLCAVFAYLPMHS
jgi:hypothetical protein